MKKVILLALLVVIFLLIIPSVVSAKGEVSIIPTPHFHRDLVIIKTDGDSVRYSFTITNIGNETIKDQKLWYDLNSPSGISYGFPAIDIPELKSGENITLEPRGIHLKEVGDFTLSFGINSYGNKDADNSVIVNGEIDTRNLVQHSFNAYDKNYIVVGTLIAILGTLLLLIGSWFKKR